MMRDMGVIEPSKSEWCSPIVLVPKKDGSLRFCLDFRKLNAISILDAYPIPRIGDLIECLGKANYISTLDMCKVYWQVPLNPAAKDLAAFRTPFGLLQFMVMPFGLHDAAATFQRLMDQVLRGAEAYAAAYIDNVVIYSENWMDHLAHVADIFQRIQQTGLNLNPSKCSLGRKEVKYLGYVFGDGNIKLQVGKVDATSTCPTPTTKKQVRSFLGLDGLYRRFIPSSQ